MYVNGWMGNCQVIDYDYQIVHEATIVMWAMVTSATLIEIITDLPTWVITNPKVMTKKLLKKFASNWKNVWSLYRGVWEHAPLENFEN